MLIPSEVIKTISDAGVKKGTASFKSLSIKGFFAGIFIAFAAVASTIASENLTANPETFGIGKFLAGSIFAAGLIMVVLMGAELFTGNVLMLIALFEKRIKLRDLLYNWEIVYLFNFIGSILIALAVKFSNMFLLNGGLFGETSEAIAKTKVSIGFIPAVILGILCNILVCVAVYLAFSARTIQGKILGIFFPIMLFIICGFEHSIANMYFIPAGMLVSDSMDVVTLFSNLIPVTIGNIIGGAIVASGFYFANINNKKDETKTRHTRRKN